MYQVSKVIEAVRELANEFPQAKYDRGGNQFCYYTRGKATNNCCGCIMGQAIIKAYPELEMKLRKIDGSPFAVSGVLSQLGFETTTEQDNWLTVAQDEQDNHGLWKNCVMIADKDWPLS